MPETILTNIASTLGTYAGESAVMESAPADTLLVDGLSIAKAADKKVWISGTLVYTITVENKAEQAYEDLVVKDTLNSSLVALVPGSVLVNGATTADYTYEESHGLLIVNVPDLEAGGTVTVTFQVEKR